MKRILYLIIAVLICSQAHATTYYVASSANGGSDSNNGLAGSDEGEGVGPWETISKVNTTVSTDGDDVYFLCDNTWTLTADSQRLDVDWSGLSTSNYAEIGAYYMQDGSPVTSDDTNFSLAGHAKPIIHGGGNTTDTRGYPGNTYNGLINITYENFVRVSNLDLRYSGGCGIYIDYSTYVWADYVRVELPYASGIIFNHYSTYGKVSNCESTGDNRYWWYLCSGSPYCTDDWGYAIGATVQSHYLTVENNQIYEGWGEGIGLYKGADHGLIQYNVVHGQRAAEIYLSETEFSVVRYNMVFGTTDPNLQRSYNSGYVGMGIYVSHEWLTGATNQQNEIYGNLVAFCNPGLRLGCTDDPINNCNHKIYNNTFIDNATGVIVYDNKTTGLEFKNNIIWNPSSGGALIDQQHTSGWTGADIGPNLWIGTPEEAGVMNASDPGYPSSYASNDPSISKTTGWRSLSAIGDLTVADFAIDSDSDAYETGVSLGTPYTTLLRASSDMSSIPFSVDTASQDDYGDPDMGAIPVVSGDPPPSGGGGANDFSGEADCISVYNMESGALTTDSKGSNTLTDHGTVTAGSTSPPQGSNYAVFNGSDQWFELAGAVDQFGWGTSQALTVTAWAYYNNDGGTTQTIFYKTGTGKTCLRLYYQNNQLVCGFGISDGDSFEYKYHGTTNLSNATWYMAYVTLDSSKTYHLGLYDTNGDLVGLDKTGTIAGTPNLNEDGDVGIGARSISGAGANFLAGRLDEVTIWDEAQSASVLEQIADGTIGASAAPTIATIGTWVETDSPKFSTSRALDIASGESGYIAFGLSEQIINFGNPEVSRIVFQLDYPASTDLYGGYVKQDSESGTYYIIYEIRGGYSFVDGDWTQVKKMIETSDLAISSIDLVTATMRDGDGNDLSTSLTTSGTDPGTVTITVRPTVMKPGVSMVGGSASF